MSRLSSAALAPLLSYLSNTSEKTPMSLGLRDYGLELRIYGSAMGLHMILSMDLHMSVYMGLNIWVYLWL